MEISAHTLSISLCPYFKVLEKSLHRYHDHVSYCPKTWLCFLQSYKRLLLPHDQCRYIWTGYWSVHQKLLYSKFQICKNALDRKSFSKKKPRDIKRTKIIFIFVKLRVNCGNILYNISYRSVLFSLFFFTWYMTIID